VLLVAHSLPIQADPKPQAESLQKWALGFPGTDDLCEQNRRLPDEQ
jgi:hypothetical protein